jgi:hypothetical protein
LLHLPLSRGPSKKKSAVSPECGSDGTSSFKINSGWLEAN